MPKLVIVRPWTLTCDLDHWTWPRWYQVESACQVSWSEVISFESYCQHTRRTDCCTRQQNVPFIKLLKIYAQSDPPLQKMQILLKSAWAVKASEKSSIIANRKSTMRFPSSHRWTLCLLPPRIVTFGVAFNFFVAGNCRHFKFGMWVQV